MIGFFLSLFFATAFFFFGAPPPPFIYALLPFFPLSLLLFWLFLMQNQAKTFQNEKKAPFFRSAFLYLKDSKRLLSSLYLTFFLFASFALLLIHESIDEKTTLGLFSLWILLLGLAIDALFFGARQSISFTDPFHLLKKIENEAKKASRNSSDLLFSDWLIALIDISLYAIKNDENGLLIKSLESVDSLMSSYFEQAKSMTLEQSEEDRDIINLTLFRLLENLQDIERLSLEKKNAVALSTLCRLYGNQLVNVADYDMTLTPLLVKNLSDLGTSASQNNMDKAFQKCKSALIASSKMIVQEVDITYYKLIDCFLPLIEAISAFCKIEFKKDKTQSIDLVKQPLLDLKNFFKQSPLNTHKDAKVIFASLDESIAAFDTLKLVLKEITLDSDEENNQESSD